MARNERTAVIIDALLEWVLVGGGLTIAALAPNAVQLLDKPLKGITNHWMNAIDKENCLG